MNRRRVCLHEAGHAVAVLLKDDRATAAMLGANGLAIIGVPDPLQTFCQVLTVAAESLRE